MPIAKKAKRYKHPARELIERTLYKYIEQYQMNNAGTYPTPQWIEAKRQYLMKMAQRLEKQHKLIGGS